MVRSRATRLYYDEVNPRKTRPTGKLVCMIWILSNINNFGPRLMFYCLAAASAERGAQIVCGQYYIKAIWCGGGRKPPLLLVRWPAVRERSMWPWNKRHSYILSQRMLRSYSTSTLWKRWFIHSNNVLFVWQTWTELERGFLCFNSQWTGWGLHVFYSLLSKCPVELCNLVHSAEGEGWCTKSTRGDLLSDAGYGYLLSTSHVNCRA